MPKKSGRTWNQAAFQYACEFVGCRQDVSIDGQRVVSATSVAIRDPQDQGYPPRVLAYELTLFDAGGQWRQFRFDLDGEIFDANLGAPESAPKISQSQEVF